MTAAYFGTFEPFQNYHLDILEKASRLFDKIYVVISVNSRIRKNYNFIDCKQIIENVIKSKGIGNGCVVCSYGLDVNFCVENNVDYIIRGFKENLNTHTEQEAININKEINKETKTMFLVSDYPYISTKSLIELVRNRVDATAYIPKEYFDYMVAQETKKES